MPINNFSKMSDSSQKKSSFLSVIKSVGAAFMGVQSNKNRERDFSEGKLSHFIIVGVACTAIFIAVLIVVVSLVLP
jgi:hypothetical protein